MCTLEAINLEDLSDFRREKKSQAVKFVDGKPRMNCSVMTQKKTSIQIKVMSHEI